jgi:hypothetical protein
MLKRVLIVVLVWEVGQAMLGIPAGIAAAWSTPQGREALQIIGGWFHVGY